MWMHWHILHGARWLYVWHEHPYLGTGAVWDDTNVRLTAAEVQAVAADTLGQLPWAAILTAWSAPAGAGADDGEQTIYGRALRPGTRVDD